MASVLVALLHWLRFLFRSLKNIEGKITLHLLPYFGERRKISTITTAMLRGFVVERQSNGPLEC